MDIFFDETIFPKEDSCSFIDDTLITLSIIDNFSSDTYVVHHSNEPHE